MLGIILNLVQNTGCGSLVITDGTGIYDVVLNPTGWGVPNPIVADVTAAKVIITNTYTVQAVEVDIFAQFADMFTTGITLTSLAVIGSALWPDGYYEIEYVVTTGGTEYSYTHSFGMQCQVECCVRRAALLQKFPICNFKDVERANVMVYLFSDLILAGCCGNVEQYNTILGELQKYCTGNGSLGTNQLTNSGCGCNN